MNGQLLLFGGVQSVHVGRRSPETGVLVCAVCKVSLVVAASWDCDPCRGLVESVPPWAQLPGDAPEAVVPELEAA